MIERWSRAQEGAPGFVWFLIIVATIIAQMVRLFRRPSQRPRAPAPPATGGEKAPQDELSEFLRQLTGVPQQPEPPAPPPVPVTRPKAPPRPVQRPQRVTARQAPSVPPAPAVPVKAPVSIHHGAYRVTRGRRKDTLLRREVLRMMDGRKGLRQSILLREMLGPPRGARPLLMQAR